MYENLRRRKSLYVFTALKVIFFNNLLVHVHIFPIFPSYLSVRRKMSDLAGNIRAPKKAGGRTKIHNNCEGLSKDVIIPRISEHPLVPKKMLRREITECRKSEDC